MRPSGPHRAAAAAVFVLVTLLATIAHGQDAPAPPPTDEIVPPEVTEVPAVYPPEAEKAGLEATVKLELTLDATGALIDAKLLEPVGHGFDEAALEAVRQFKFTPATKAGKPIAIRILYEITFALKKQEVEVKSTRGALTGKVLDERGQPVAKVTIEVLSPEGTPIGAAVTGTAGAFQIGDLPPGPVTVILTPPDPELLIPSEVDEMISEGEELTVNYTLSPATNLGSPTESPDYETVVRGRPRREEIARKTITLQEIVRIPGVQGDAVRAVENFPGVARPPFNNGLVIIRGSAPEDSSVYIHGFWVPLVFHFGGLTSIINSDILSKVDFLPGNYSGRYGRATGGIIDVSTRKPKKKWTGYLEVDLIDANFLVEGKAGPGTIALAARRSYIDAYLGAILPEDAGFDFTSAPVYYDYQVLYDLKVAGGDLTMLLFGSDDQLRFLFADPAELDPAIRGTVSTHIGLNRLHAIWQKKLDRKNELRLAAGVGTGLFEFALGPALTFELNAIYSGLRGELTHRISKDARLTVGYDQVYVPYNIFVRAPRPPQEGEFPAQPISGQEIITTKDTSNDFTPALYAELELKLGKTTLYPSSRIDYFRFGQQFTVSPRINARHELTSATVLKGGLGLFTQPTQPWEVNPNFGNPNARGEHGLHLALGAEHSFDGRWKGWSVDSSLFYKSLWDLIVRSNNLVERDQRVTIENYSNEGAGRIFGGELLVRRELTSNFFALLSYTLMRSERKDREGGEYRPFDFDQTHIASLVLSRKFGKSWQLGARFRYVSGNPQTPARAGIYDADGDVYIPIPGEPNSNRLPAFHQLDLRLDKQWKWDSWNLSLYLDVQNAYSRLNPEGFFYSYDFAARSTVTGLPIIPSLGMRGEF